MYLRLLFASLRKAIASQYGAATSTGQEPVTIAGRPATTYLTDYTVQGQPLQVRVTPVVTQKDVWAFFAVTPTGQGGDVLGHIYSSITLP